MPRTFNDLFDRICSIDNLTLAAHKAALGKRDKPYVDAFRLNLERELWALRRELLDSSYRPGPYRSF